MSRYIKSSNPFEEEDDAPSSYSSNSSSSRTNGESPFEDRRQQIQRKVETSENNQLDSTQRALAAIYESEAMGVATAEVIFTFLIWLDLNPSLISFLIVCVI